MALIRFAIVHSDTGGAETGANYPGCNPQNPNACDPQSFPSVDAAKSYADSHGEALYVLGAALPGTPQWSALLNQVWSYVGNPALIPPPGPVALPTHEIFGSASGAAIIGAGVLAYFVFFRKKGGSQ